MEYNFDTVHLEPHRTALGSEKWLAAKENGCPQNIVPLTVADMEFASAPEIVEELTRLAQLGLWGYTKETDTYLQAVTEWMKKRHNWNTDSSWIVCTNGVIPAITTAIRAFTRPGERILIQPPVYPPFYGCVENSDRIVLENPLICKNGRYTIDYEDLEQKAPLARMMILCSPHNPAGRVWTPEELIKIAEICYKNKIILMVDEIHHDIIMPGYQHTPFGTLDKKYQNQCIIGTAASKTFSLAGLGCSNIFIQDKNMRSVFKNQMAKDWVSFNSTFGMVATRAAYCHGLPWMEQMIEYVWENYKWLAGFIQNNMPVLTISPLEGTYLAWIDFSSIPLTPSEMEHFMRTEASLYLNNGTMFGTGGEGRFRVNLACPRSVLQERMESLKMAMKKKELL